MNDDTYDLLARAIEHARGVVRASECSEAFASAAAECLLECERCLPSLDRAHAKRAAVIADRIVSGLVLSQKEHEATDVLDHLTAAILRLAGAAAEMRFAEGDLRRLIGEVTK